MKSKSLNTLLIAASVLSFAACNKENGLEQAHQDRSLSFELSMAAVSHDTDESGASTKSMEIKSADGSITLPMEYRVTDGIGESPLAGEAQTKGEQINSETEMLGQNIVSFKVKAWNYDNSQFLPREGSGESTVNYTNEKWTLDGETAPLWKNADTKTFFAYANLPDGATVSCTNTDDDNSFHTFSYSSLQTDATAQKDALLGYYKGNGGLGGVAKIQFVHPLTAVVFKQGVFEGDFTIKSLSLEGVYKGGVANVTYAYDDTYGDIVPTFDWGTSRSETITVSQNIPDPGTPPGPGKKIGQSFILIPQNLAEKNVIIKAIVTTTTGDQEIMANLNTGEWMAGKTNTYTLNYDSHTYTYEFTSDINTTTFLTITPEPQNVTINSKKTNELGQDSSIGWFIKSVQVGAGEIEEINNTSFTYRGGIKASQTEDSKLKIEAVARTDENPGIHEYWTGGHGNWSPEDWSESRATSSSPLDLSKFNFQTEETTTTMTTANCYIIRHAGTYKLPLVYGNAVVNGSDNEQSYFPNVTGTCTLKRFVNSTGAGIESPFIENATDCGGENLKCAVIWQDKAEVVKSLSIVDGASAGTVGSYDATNVRYLQFTVDKSTICQNNALICVYKDKEGGNANQYDAGEAIWSWHIWTTNDPALLSPAIPVYNYENKKYDFFPLNCLGWTDNTDITETKHSTFPSKEDVKIVLAQNDSDSDKEIILTVKQNSVYMASVSCYYQWGRKDPMCPIDTTPAQGSFSLGSANVSLAFAICNPNIIYAVDKKNWCSQNCYNLWTGKKSATGLFDQESDMIKTIYDPSPVGYKMPASKAFTGFSTTGGNVNTFSNWNIYGVFSNGCNFYTKKGKEGDTIFFPCPTYRGGSSGSVEIHQLGNQGYYWTAVPSNTNFGQNLTIYSTQDLCVPSSANGLALGFSVRPVLE